jgi:TonB family protein
MKKLMFVALLLSSFTALAQVQFNNGKIALNKFLEDNTVYPSYSKYNCIQGRVEIGFKVNLKGEIYNSKIVKGIGTDLDDEALRLIRLSSGKWTLANANDTSSVVIIPVNFVLSGYDCDRKSPAEIQNAIQAYQNELAMENAIINFYKNRDKGTTEQEAKIIALKSQLGIDDEYLNERIKCGLQKVKQGDKHGACEDFNFVKNMGSNLANNYLKKYCN